RTWRRRTGRRPLSRRRAGPLTGGADSAPVPAPQASFCSVSDWPVFLSQYQTRLPSANIKLFDNQKQLSLLSVPANSDHTYIPF
ncbi:hypothetical protein, partial [Mixta calida]